MIAVDWAVNRPHSVNVSSRSVPWRLCVLVRGLCHRAGCKQWSPTHQRKLLRIRWYPRNVRPQVYHVSFSRLLRSSVWRSLVWFQVFADVLLEWRSLPAELEWIQVRQKLSLSHVGWRRSVVVSVLSSINAVNRHWARLLLGWVTARGKVNCHGV